MYFICKDKKSSESSSVGSVLQLVFPVLSKVHAGNRPSKSQLHLESLEMMVNMSAGELGLNCLENCLRTLSICK